MTARKARPAIGSSQQQHAGPRPATGNGRSDRRSGSAARGTTSRTLPDFTRPALAPSLLAAVVLLACVAFIDSSAFVFAR
jgi:hypothetical protein